MKLLLHCCCAPCTISCAAALQDEGITPDLFWYNPNIHPVSEYSLRRDCLRTFANNENLHLQMIDEYGLRDFLKEVYPEIENRCEKCYRMRMEKTAAFAAQNGYEAFTTTLLISPYQKHDVIKTVCEEAAAKYRSKFLYRDFRPLFREGQTKARAQGFYMQKYCGCIFSDDERHAQRQEKSYSKK